MTQMLTFSSRDFQSSYYNYDPQNKGKNTYSEQKETSPQQKNGNYKKELIRNYNWKIKDLKI